MDQSIISLAYKYNGWGIALYILIVTLVSGLLSAIIGVEREIKGQAAGLRTHVLLSIGCTLIMTISIFGIGFASGQIDFSQGYIDASKLSYDTLYSQFVPFRPENTISFLGMSDGRFASIEGPPL